MKRLYSRIELAFWDTVIPLLSESEFVRNSLREVHNLYLTRSNGYLYILLSWACTALIIGFVLGRSRIFLW